MGHLCRKQPSIWSHCKPFPCQVVLHDHSTIGELTLAAKSSCFILSAKSLCEMLSWCSLLHSFAKEAPLCIHAIQDDRPNPWGKGDPCMARLLRAVSTLCILMRSWSGILGPGTNHACTLPSKLSASKTPLEGLAMARMQDCSSGHSRSEQSGAIPQVSCNLGSQWFALVAWCEVLGIHHLQSTITCNATSNAAEVPVLLAWHCPSLNVPGGLLPALGWCGWGTPDTPDTPGTPDTPAPDTPDTTGTESPKSAAVSGAAQLGWGRVCVGGAAATSWRRYGPWDLPSSMLETTSRTKPASNKGDARC